MSQYLKSINHKFNSKSYSDWCLSGVRWLCSESNDPISNIIIKYDVTTSNLNSFSIDDTELELLLEEYNEEYNILIKSSMDYLIASSKGRNKSRLVDDCMTFIDLYFESIEEKNGTIPLYSLSIVIKWTIKKFPKSKSSLKNYILNNIFKGSKSAFSYLFFIDYFLRDEKLCDMISTEDYEKIYDKYFMDKTDEAHINLYLRFYDKYLEYVREKDKANKKSFLKRYCFFVIDNIDLIPNRIKQVLLQKVRNYLNELDINDDNLYYIIYENLQKANEEALSSLKTISVEMPREEQVQMEGAIRQQIESYTNLSNPDKIDKFLLEAVPISLDNLKSTLKKTEGTLARFFPTKYLDINGRVINYDNHNKSEMFSLESRDFIALSIQFYFDLFISPFFKTFEFTEDASLYLKKMLENNKLVSSKRINLLHSLFSKFFKKDFSNSLFSIVEELEESLRFYFQNERMNIYKKNGKGDFIGLNNIFNDNEKNSYRDKICETIDEDFYFTLKWFLVDDYGYGLRNKIAHRYETIDLDKSKHTIYAVIQILRLYWGFKID